MQKQPQFVYKCKLCDSAKARSAASFCKILLNELGLVFYPIFKLKPALTKKHRREMAKSITSEKRSKFSLALLC